MKRTTLNAIIDTITFFPLFFTAITGIIIWLYLPRGLAIGALGTIASHQTFLGIQQQVWLDTHMYVGLVFIALVAIHLILHWHYLKNFPQRFAEKKTKKDHSARRFLALLLIGLLIVAAVIAAVYALNPSPSSTNLQKNISTTASSSTTKTTTTTMTAKATGSVTPTASSTSRVSSTPTPNPTPTSINGIPTNVNGLDYIYYHNLNDRSTCILCHTNM
jgi:cytoskeletal protein RodZ